MGPYIKQCRVKSTEIKKKQAQDGHSILKDMISIVKKHSSDNADDTPTHSHSPFPMGVVEGMLYNHSLALY